MPTVARTPGAAARTLDQLPTEIILEILQQLNVIRGFRWGLDDERNRRVHNIISVVALRNLARTCQRLNNLTTPFLYGSIIGVGMSGSWPAVVDFSNTIAKKPELMSHVRYIELDCHEDWSTEVLYHSNLISNTLTQLAKHAHWGPAICRIYDYGGLGPRFMAERLLAALISFAHNLQSFAIPDCFLTFVVNMVSPYPCGLRELWVTSPTSGIACVRTQVVPETDENHILRFLRRDHTKRVGKTFPGNATCSVVVEELVLEPNWNDLDIHDVLARCASLRKFTCRWGSEGVQDGHDVAFHKLRGNLARFESTLEYLAIGPRYADFVNGNSAKLIGNLRQFTSLKHLKIFGSVLWRDQPEFEEHGEPIGVTTVTREPYCSILPSSLETLLIETRWSEPWIDSLNDLARDCPIFLPNLKLVDCSWRPNTDRIPALIGKDLIANFQRSGVTLNLDIGTDMDWYIEEHATKTTTSNSKQLNSDIDTDLDW